MNDLKPGQYVFYKTWMGVNRDYRQVLMAARVAKLLPKRVKIDLVAEHLEKTVDRKSLCVLNESHLQLLRLMVQHNGLVAPRNSSLDQLIEAGYAVDEGLHYEAAVHGKAALSFIDHQPADHIAVSMNPQTGVVTVTSANGDAEAERAVAEELAGAMQAIIEAETSQPAPFAVTHQPATHWQRWCAYSRGATVAGVTALGYADWLSEQLAAAERQLNEANDSIRNRQTMLDIAVQHAQRLGYEHSHPYDCINYLVQRIGTLDDFEVLLQTAMEFTGMFRVSFPRQDGMIIAYEYRDGKGSFSQTVLPVATVANLLSDRGQS